MVTGICAYFIISDVFVQNAQSYYDELMMAKKHNIVIINLIKFQNVIITHIVEVLMVLAVLLHLNC